MRFQEREGGQQSQREVKPWKAGGALRAVTYPMARLKIVTLISLKMLIKISTGKIKHYYHLCKIFSTAFQLNLCPQTSKRPTRVHYARITLWIQYICMHIICVLFWTPLIMHRYKHQYTDVPPNTYCENLQPTTHLEMMKVTVKSNQELKYNTNIRKSKTRGRKTGSRSPVI